MDSVLVEKARLLEALHANMATHAAKVARSREVYRAMIIAELDKRLAQAMAGEFIEPGFLRLLPIPEDFTESYREAIAQLEWETRDTIDLAVTDFNRYVLDKWEWVQRFAASNSAYLTE